MCCIPCNPCLIGRRRYYTRPSHLLYERRIVKKTGLRYLLEKFAAQVVGYVKQLEHGLKRLWESCIEPIQRNCSYVFYYKRYVKQLEHGLKRLCDVRAALRREVETAKSQRKSISPEVESWIAEVDAIEEATQRFISDAESKKHFYEPLARYWLSHKSVEMLGKLSEREQEGNRFHNVADPAPPPRIGSTFVRILNPKFSRPN